MRAATIRLPENDVSASPAAPRSRSSTIRTLARDRGAARQRNREPDRFQARAAARAFSEYFGTALK
jgi:hypothetical protein